MCDRCKTKQTAMKQMSIRRLPLILSLHVKRFKQTDGKVGSQLTMFPHFTYKSLRTYICSNRHSSLQTYILRTCTEFSQTSYMQILNIVPYTLLEQLDGKVCPQPTAFPNITYNPVPNVFSILNPITPTGLETCNSYHSYHHYILMITTTTTIIIIIIIIIIVVVIVTQTLVDQNVRNGPLGPSPSPPEV
jgi:hypothetical protein